MKKVIITGGAGFIGSQLAWYLHDKGHDVTAYDNLSYGNLDNLLRDGKVFPKIIIGDVSLPIANETPMQNVDYLFHFAGISSLPICQENPVEAYKNNVLSTVNLLELSTKLNIKNFVLASTSAVYENGDPSLETSSPDLVYATTKLNAEKVCINFAKVNKRINTKTTILRFYNVYGPHQDIHRTMPPFTSYLIKNAVDDKSINIYNSSSALRDYVYITDLLDCLDKIMSSNLNSGQIIDIGTGNGISVNTIIETVESLLNKRLNITYQAPEEYWNKFWLPYLSKTRIKKEVEKNCVCESEYARQVLNWKPKVSLKTGLENIIKFYEKK